MTRAGDPVDGVLSAHQDKPLLRFLTCGSVDDGKSTLLGRLLHDSKLVSDDQLAALRIDSAKYGTTGTTRSATSSRAPSSASRGRRR